VAKEHDNEIRRSVKRSNLTRQQEFKKMKKNQKRSGNFPFFPNYYFLFRLEKSVSSLGDALDSMVRLTTTTTTNDSYNFQTDFV
jgi:hypothetical protein